MMQTYLKRKLASETTKLAEQILFGALWDNESLGEEIKTLKVALEIANDMVSSDPFIALITQKSMRLENRRNRRKAKRQRKEIQKILKTKAKKEALEEKNRNRHKRLQGRKIS